MPQERASHQLYSRKKGGFINVKAGIVEGKAGGGARGGTHSDKRSWDVLEIMRKVLRPHAGLANFDDGIFTSLFLDDSSNILDNRLVVDNRRGTVVEEYPHTVAVQIAEMLCNIFDAL